MPRRVLYSTALIECSHLANVREHPSSLARARAASVPACIISSTQNISTHFQEGYFFPSAQTLKVSPPTSVCILFLLAYLVPGTWYVFIELIPERQRLRRNRQAGSARDRPVGSLDYAWARTTQQERKICSQQYQYTGRTLKEVTNPWWNLPLV